MAGSEESNPLLQQKFAGDEATEEKAGKPVVPEKTMIDGSDESVGVGVVAGWTAEGLPMGTGSVVGEPAGRGRWSSNFFACFGRSDEFCSSDLEVCFLGAWAPCVLYGSNTERLGGYGGGSFANHCLAYSGLCLLGNALFGANWLAPWFTYRTRSAIRRRFNLEGSCEALSRSCGCCGGILEDEVQREHCESACDFAAHFLCHACSLCQEGRELRRRLPHPGFSKRPFLVMIAPMEQSMRRDGA